MATKQAQQQVLAASPRHHIDRRRHLRLRPVRRSNPSSDGQTDCRAEGSDVRTRRSTPRPADVPRPAAHTVRLQGPVSSKGPDASNGTAELKLSHAPGQLAPLGGNAWQPRRHSVAVVDTALSGGPSSPSTCNACAGTVAGRRRPLPSAPPLTAQRLRPAAESPMSPNARRLSQTVVLQQQQQPCDMQTVTLGSTASVTSVGACTRPFGSRHASAQGSSQRQEQLRDWGPVYFRSAMTADIFVAAVPLAMGPRPVSASPSGWPTAAAGPESHTVQQQASSPDALEPVTNGIAGPATRLHPITSPTDAPDSHPQQQHQRVAGRETRTVCARIHPRAPERPTFLMQRTFDVAEMRATVPPRCTWAGAERLSFSPSPSSSKSSSLPSHQSSAGSAMLSPVSDLADQLSRLPGPGGSNINNRRHSVANAGCARVITREAAVRDEEARVRQDHDKDGDVKMIDARPVAGPGNTQATVRRVSSFRAKLLTIQQRELRSCPQSSSPLHATATSSSRPLLLPVHFEYARALPVLAAFMLSGHVRAGDALEMPVPWPEAWEATLAWAYYCWPTVRPLHSDHEKDMAKAKMHVDVELETGVEEEEGKEKEEDRNEEGNEKDSMEEDGRKGEREKEGGKKEEGKEKGNVKETEEMVLFEKVRENVRYLCGVI